MTKDNCTYCEIYKDTISCTLPNEIRKNFQRDDEILVDVMFYTAMHCEYFAKVEKENIIESHKDSPPQYQPPQPTLTFQSTEEWIQPPQPVMIDKQTQTDNPSRRDSAISMSVSTEADDNTETTSLASSNTEKPQTNAEDDIQFEIANEQQRFIIDFQMDKIPILSQERIENDSDIEEIRPLRIFRKCFWSPHQVYDIALTTIYGYQLSIQSSSRTVSLRATQQAISQKLETIDSGSSRNDRNDHIIPTGPNSFARLFIQQHTRLEIENFRSNPGSEMHQSCLLHSEHFLKVKAEAKLLNSIYTMQHFIINLFGDLTLEESEFDALIYDVKHLLIDSENGEAFSWLTKILKKTKFYQKLQFMKGSHNFQKREADKLFGHQHYGSPPDKPREFSDNDYKIMSYISDPKRCKIKKITTDYLYGFRSYDSLIRRMATRLVEVSREWEEFESDVSYELMIEQFEKLHLKASSYDLWMIRQSLEELFQQAMRLDETDTPQYLCISNTSAERPSADGGRQRTKSGKSKQNGKSFWNFL